MAEFALLRKTTVHLGSVSPGNPGALEETETVSFFASAAGSPDWISELSGTI